jgi:hypothetical protein
VLCVSAYVCVSMWCALSVSVNASGVRFELLCEFARDVSRGIPQ